MVRISGGISSKGGGSHGGGNRIHIDVGGTGRYEEAINLNRDTIGRAGYSGAAEGERIPNLIVGDAYRMPFSNRTADLITVENSPIVASEISRVIKPGGQIRLLSPDGPTVRQLHQSVMDSVRGRTSQSVNDGMLQTIIDVAE